MSLNVKHNGSFKAPSTISYRDGGTWRTGAEAFIKNNGVWTSIWSGAIKLTLSTNQATPTDLRVWALANGWDGTSGLQVTVDTGIILSSDNSATPALTITGDFPKGVTLINRGRIIGQGGAGGRGSWRYGDGDSVELVGEAGYAGGTAIDVSVAVIIDNQGEILGGGGGGGGSEAAHSDGYGTGIGGNGGGGGQSGLTDAPGGAAGRYRSPGTAALDYGNEGLPGTISAPGVGGEGFEVNSGALSRADDGGDGGVWGANGNMGGQSFKNLKSGGQVLYSTFAGGAGGLAVNGNSNINWTTTGVRTGGIV
jgi:hypothetical protein